MMIDDRFMSETEIHRFGLSDPQDTEVVRYRAVSGLAVGVLVIALFSPIALAHPVLWTVPVIGIVTCVLALMRIGRETPPLIGRKAAPAGPFGAGVPGGGRAGAAAPPR